MPDHFAKFVETNTSTGLLIIRQKVSIHRALEEFLIVDEGAFRVGDNHIRGVQVFGEQPVQRIRGALIIASVVIGVKVILAGIPAFLIPVRPALHMYGRFGCLVGR